MQGCESAMTEAFSGKSEEGELRYIFVLADAIYPTGRRCENGGFLGAGRLTRTIIQILSFETRNVMNHAINMTVMF